MKTNVTLNGQRSWIALVACLLATVAPLDASPYSDLILADQPFAYYRLNEAQDSYPAEDEQGNHHGTYEWGPDVGVAGAIRGEPGNTAVAFSRAKRQFVQLTTFGDFGTNMTQGFTVEFWLKASDARTYQVILGTTSSPSYITDFLVDIAYGKKPGRLRLYYRDDQWRRYEANFYTGPGTAKIFDDAWHLITQVYDPQTPDANDRVQFYVDGVKQTITVFQGKGVPSSSDFNQALTLGALNNRGAVQGHLEGSLDEVAFYKHVLTPQQILNHYRAAFP
jgi:hypothetical protein